MSNKASVICKAPFLDHMSNEGRRIAIKKMLELTSPVDSFYQR